MSDISSYIVLYPDFLFCLPILVKFRGKMNIVYIVLETPKGKIETWIKFCDMMSF